MEWNTTLEYLQLWEPSGPQNKKKDLNKNVLDFNLGGFFYAKPEKLNIFRLTQFLGYPWGLGLSWIEKLHNTKISCKKTIPSFWQPPFCIRQKGLII